MSNNTKVKLSIAAIIFSAYWINETSFDSYATTIGALAIMVFCLAVIMYCWDWIKKKIVSWFKKKEEKDPSI